MAIKGMIYVVLSAFLFGFTPILAKQVYADGISSAMVVHLRALISILPPYVICKYKHIDLRLTKRQLFYVGVVAVFGHALTNIFLYGSYAYIDVGTATVIHFYYPVVVVILSVLLLKKTISKQMILLFGIATIGVSCFMTTIETSQMTGIILAACSAVTFAFYMVGTEKFKIQSIEPFKVTFYFSVFVSIVSLVYALSSGGYFLQLSCGSWVNMLIISLGTSVFGIAFLQKGITTIGARDASLLSTLEPITSLLFGYLMLNEELLPNKLLGSALILISVLCMVLLNGKRRRSS